MAVFLFCHVPCSVVAIREQMATFQAETIHQWMMKIMDEGLSKFMYFTAGPNGWLNGRIMFIYYMFITWLSDTNDSVIS